MNIQMTQLTGDNGIPSSRLHTALLAMQANGRDYYYFFHCLRMSYEEFLREIKRRAE